MANESVAVFQTISDKLLEPVVKVMDTGLENLAATIEKPFAVAATIYIMFLGYNVIYGRSQIPLWDFIATAAKIGIILALITNIDNYNYWVKNLFFTDLPNTITGIMKTSPITSNTWDTMINDTISNIFKAARKSRGFWSIVVWTIGAFCISFSVLFCVVGFIVTLFAQVGLSLILSLGPIFIALYLFPSTRNFTQAWLGQVANFVILQVLVLLLGGLFIGIIKNIFEQPVTDIFISLAQFIAVGLCGVYLFINLPGIASALAAGGATLSSGQLSKQAGEQARGAAKAAGGAAKTAGKKIASRLKGL